MYIQPVQEGKESTKQTKISILLQRKGQQDRWMELRSNGNKTGHKVYTICLLEND